MPSFLPLVIPSGDMGLLVGRYGFPRQEIWVSSSGDMGLLVGRYGFPRQEIWVSSSED